MGARGYLPPGLERRAVEASGLLGPGPLPSRHRLLDPLPSPDFLENKIAAQAGEIERLAADNHVLATSHLTLRADLIAAQQEVERLQAHIRSIHTESDIQIRLLLDKIGKIESNIQAGEHVKEELQHAHKEAESLVKARHELTTQIQEVSQELTKLQGDVETLPDMLKELENLRNERHRLRTTFEYQKGLNMEKVDQLRRMEQHLIGMAREIETLQSEVFKVEARARAPNSYPSGHANPASYLPPVHAAGLYADSYGSAPVQIVVGPDGTTPYGLGK